MREICGMQNDDQEPVPDVTQSDTILWTFQRNALSPDHMVSNPIIQNAMAGL
jgi:hypothetical protein